MNKEAVKFFEEKLQYEIDPYSVRHIVDEKDEGYSIIDVRDKDSYSKGHIPGSINIPGSEIEGQIGKLAKDKTLIFYCYHITCFAAPKAALKFAKHDCNVMEMVGGFDEWQKNGHPIEK